MKNPFKNIPIHTGFLSFLLPGLGQLYQHRIGVALPFFVAFIGLLWSPWRLWVFVPMAVAAWEAQRIPHQPAIVWNARSASYFLVGSVAFFASFSLFVERVVAYPQLGKMRYVADALAGSLNECGVKNRVMPSHVGECAGAAKLWRNDPWGQPYQYRPGEGGFEIISLGRDGLAATEDDFVFRFHLPAALRAGAGRAE